MIREKFHKPLINAYEGLSNEFETVGHEFAMEVADRMPHLISLMALFAIMGECKVQSCKIPVHILSKSGKCILHECGMVPVKVVDNVAH